MTTTTATTGATPPTTANRMNEIDQGIVLCELEETHRALFRAHARLLDAIRTSVGPRHYAMIQPALTPEERAALARVGLLLDTHHRGVRPALWFYGQKYLREQWGGGR